MSFFILIILIIVLAVLANSANSVKPDEKINLENINFPEDTPYPITFYTSKYFNKRDGKFKIHTSTCQFSGSSKYEIKLGEFTSQKELIKLLLRDFPRRNFSPCHYCLREYKELYASIFTNEDYNFYDEYFENLKNS